MSVVIFVLYIGTVNRETVATEHPPQDTKIVAGPSTCCWLWYTAWLGIQRALVGWLEVRTVVESLVGLEIAWWWVLGCYRSLSRCVPPPPLAPPWPSPLACWGFGVELLRVGLRLSLLLLFQLPIRHASLSPALPPLIPRILLLPGLFFAPLFHPPSLFILRSV